MGSHHYHEPVYGIVSHRIRIVHRISHRIASHPYRIRLVSYRLTSQRTVSCRIATYRYRIVSCRIVSLLLSYRTAPCRDRIVFVSYPYPCRLTNQRIVSHRVLSLPLSYRTRIVSVVSSHEPLYRTVSYRTVLYRIVPYRTMLYRIVTVIVSYPYRLTNHRIASYRIVSYHILASPRLHVSTSPRRPASPRFRPPRDWLATCAP